MLNEQKTSNSDIEYLEWRDESNPKPTTFIVFICDRFCTKKMVALEVMQV